MTRKLRRLLWPGVMAGAMVAVLLGIGTWQVWRLAWKQALLAEIDRAEAAAPAPLGPAQPPPFATVAVTGLLRADLAALYGSDVRDTPEGPVLGAFLIEPLIRAGGPPVLVERGWVPESRGRPLAEPAHDVTVTGYVHPADSQSWFSASDDAATRRFFTLDPAAIGGALGLPEVAPFILVALGPAPPEGFPDPAKHLPRPPNNHLQYAITWYGLAASLVVIFAVWSRKVLRE